MINIPNLLTLFRILITPLFVIFMIKGHYRLALLMFFLAGVSDGLDGLFCPLVQQKTVLGAHLDPIADKLLLISAFVALAVQQTIPSWLAVVVISRDILILTRHCHPALFQYRRHRQAQHGQQMHHRAQLATVLAVLRGAGKSPPSTPR